MNNPQNPLQGLTKGCRLAPEQFFGRGSRFVVDASHVQTEIDNRGLTVFPISEVFKNTNSVFLGFGTPNVYLTVPKKDREGWLRLSAFMFWRSKSEVEETNGFVQAGMLVELMNLPVRAHKQLISSMYRYDNRRCITCAHQNARVLTEAGFTCGGKSLSKYVRPSRLARAIWTHGLEWEGQEVDIRIVRTGESLVEHFTNVWKREATAPLRTVKRLISSGHKKEYRPAIEPRILDEANNDWIDRDGHTVMIGVSRPSWIGARFSNLFGEHPIFTAWPEQRITNPALHLPLVAYPGKKDWITRIKRYVLFSKPVIWTLRRMLSGKVDKQGEVPAQALINMIRYNENDPLKYNLVAISGDEGKVEIRITRLENQSHRDNKFVNWVVAKHVLVSGYHPQVIYACEMWIVAEKGKAKIAINRNSGTYKPEEPRLTAFAEYLHRVLGKEVVIYDNN